MIIWIYWLILLPLKITLTKRSSILLYFVSSRLLRTMPNYGDTRGGYDIRRVSYGITSCRGNRGVPLLVPYISHGCCKVVDAGGWLCCGKEALQKHQRLYKETVLQWRWMDTILQRFYTVFNALHSCKRYLVLCSWDTEEIPSSVNLTTFVTTSFKLV